ncbi:peptidase S15 [Candidatus Gastranaerophilus sp. (ex Termes propinquus)]|nr:peptidase S15 [Candidatus Gastranaerophilus sp. (ex Termes propinquus)]
MENLFLKTSDGVKIAVNHYKSNKNEVLIIAPGWFMTKDSRLFLSIANEFKSRFDVLAMDFRGHGKSSGSFTFTSKESADLKTVVDFARAKYEKVYLMGFSLGGALVLIHGAAEQNVDKIIAVSAPCDFSKIENHMWHKGAWFMTIFKKADLRQWLSIRPSLSGLIAGKKVKPVDIVDKIKTPTLFVAGECDPTVHAWHTQALFDKAVCEKHFELFEKCFHAEDLFMQDKERFLKICGNWLDTPILKSYI